MRKTGLTAVGIVLFLSQFCNGKPVKMANPFKLDGLRFIKVLHEKEGVAVFSNNGVRGTGVTFSFFGKLDTKVLSAHNPNIDKVILSDGASLSPDKIRTKSAQDSQKDKWGIELGTDRESVGIEVDLDVPALVNLKSISGSFMVTVPSGSQIIETTLLEDKEKSSDKKSGIAVEMCMDWGLDGRYYLLNVPNADKLQKVTVLDEKGKLLDQTSPFSTISNNQLKLFVKKAKGSSFRLKLDLSKDVQETKVTFSIGPVTIGK